MKYTKLDDYKTLLFDFDDTLVFSLNSHIWTWRKAFKNLGFDGSTITKKEMEGYIETIFKKQNISSEDQKKLYKEKDKLFSSQIFYPKKELLKYIKNNNADKFIISNASNYSVSIMIESIKEQQECFCEDFTFEFEKEFTDIYTRDMVKNKKPETDFWKTVNKKYTLKKPICYIGDHFTDRMFAENCGIDYFEVDKELK